MSKETVLRLLQESHGTYISGEGISEKLGITRAAVWKAVKALQRDGYEIESRKSQGYRLLDAPDRLTETEIRSTLALFLFRGDDIEKEVRVLSGGERARLTFSKLILSRMNLLILDEPTNHLDIESREALETALKEFDGTIIAVSHDRYFMRQLATRFLDLGDGGRDFHGGYDDYVSWRENRAAEGLPVSAGLASALAGEKTAKDEYAEKKRSAAEKRKLEKRRAEVERAIAKTEKQIADIDDLLFGEAATDYVRAAELTDEKTVAEDRLLQLYEEFEELNAED